MTGNMPPLLSNNHWLLIIMVLFTWHRIGQTIDISDKSPFRSNINTIISATKPDSDKLKNRLISFTNTSVSLPYSVNKSTSLSSDQSTLFLSTQSPSTINYSSNKNTIEKTFLAKSTDDTFIGLLLDKQVHKNNESALMSNSTVHFDNIHGGFLLIDSIMLNKTLIKNINHKVEDSESNTTSIKKMTSLNKNLEYPLSEVSVSILDNVDSTTKEFMHKANNSVLLGNSPPFESISKEIKSSSVTPVHETTGHTTWLTNKQNRINELIENTRNDSLSTNHYSTQVEKNKINADSSFAHTSNSILEINDMKPQQFEHNKLDISVIEENKLCLAEDGWPATECSESAVLNCSYPYIGQTYRLCYSSCQWSKVDTSQCKLAHLSEIHNLILYHLHKHLTDGLYPLVEELSKVICSSNSPILSPIDRIDAFDALNALFNSPALNVHFDSQEPDQREREFNFVKSIFKVTDSLFMNPIVFETETEKNTLITFKTTETLLGLRRLVESTLRALIVQNEQNTIDMKHVPQLTLLSSESNLILMPIHRTRTGKLLTLFNNEPQLPTTNRLPHTALHLEELKDYDAGIAILSVNNLTNGGYTQNGKWQILVNPLLVTIMPAISVAANFEQTPTVNVEFTFFNHLIPLSTPVYCVRLTNTSKNYWSRSKCVLVKRNTTSAQCACSELGYLTVVTNRGSSGQLGRVIEADAFGYYGNFHQSNASKLLIGSSASSLFILLVIAFALISSLNRTWRLSKRPITNPLDQLERLSQLIKNYDDQKYNHAEQRASNDETTDKTFNQIQQSCSVSIFNDMHLLRDSHYGKKKERTLFTQKIFYGFVQIKKNLHTLVYYSISWIMAALITTLSYKLNPTGFETKRYCWVSIEGGIAFSFIVPISSLIMLNTVFILLTLRRYLHLQRIHQQLSSSSMYDHHDHVNNHHRICNFDFIFRSAHANINLFVCSLPAFAVYWFFSILALEMNTSVFLFIFTFLNFLFSSCLLLLHLPYVKHELNIFLNKDDSENLIQDNQLIKNEFNEELLVDDELIDEELIICVDFEDN